MRDWVLMVTLLKIKWRVVLAINGAGSGKFWKEKEVDNRYLKMRGWFVILFAVENGY